MRQGLPPVALRLCLVLVVLSVSCASWERERRKEALRAHNKRCGVSGGDQLWNDAAKLTRVAAVQRRCAGDAPRMLADGLYDDTVHNRVVDVNRGLTAMLLLTRAAELRKEKAKSCQQAARWRTEHRTATAELEARVSGIGPQQTHMVAIGGMVLPHTVGEDPGKARAALVRFKASHTEAIKYLDSLGCGTP